VKMPTVTPELLYIKKKREKEARETEGARG
jgi:hypothetical protein